MLLLELLEGTTSLVAPPFSTTMTMSDEGNNDDLATTTAISYTITSIAANYYADKIDIKPVHETMAYIESMSDDELAEAEKLLAEKGLEFEIIEPNFVTNDSQKIYTKNNTNN